MKSEVSIPKHIEDKLIRIKHLENVEKHLKERAQALQREYGLPHTAILDILKGNTYTH